MGEPYAERLARLRVLVATGLPMDAELGLWVLGQLERAAPAEVLRQRRDVHLLAAGSLIGGSAYQRARGIEAEARRVQSIWARLRSQTPELGTVRGHVHAAELIAPIPGFRRLLTLVKSSPL